MPNSPLTTILTSTVGLLSLFTIGFVLVMAIFIYFYVQRHIKTDSEAQAIDIIDDIK